MLVIGVFMFFGGGWTAHLPDGTTEDCVAEAQRRGIEVSHATVGGDDQGGFPSGLRCHIDNASFFIPASTGDYAGLVVWAAMLGGPSGLFLMALLHPGVGGIRRFAQYARPRN
jgi:hypothetical protein